MSLRTFAFILALGAAVNAVSENETDFWRLLKPAIGKYIPQEGTDDDVGPFTGYYINKDGQPGEHIINISFQEKKGGVEMRFFRAKKADVVKVLPQYAPAEMALQAPAFPTFVYRMSTTVDQKSFNLYFNMIQDIRNELRTIGDPNKLVFEENSAEEQLSKGHVRFNLRYAENLLGVFVITPTVVDGVHVLKVDFSIARSRAQKTFVGSVNVPVFSDKRNAVQVALSQVVSVLQLKNHVNCNEDNFRELTGFLKSIKLITFLPGTDRTPQMMPFTLRSGEDVATGFLAYLPPAPDTNDVGRFHIQISMGGKVEINSEFERMTIPEFHDFLEGLNIGRLFQSLWDKIQALFKEQMAATFPAEESHKIDYANSETSSGFLGLGSTQYLLQTTLDNTSFATLSFKDDSAEPRLRFKTDVGAAKTLEMHFNRSEFRKDAVSLFFRGFVDLMAESLKGNWRGNVSRVRKLKV